MKPILNGKYYVNEEGQLFRRVPTSIAKNGYEKVVVRIEGEKKNFLVHRLVLEAFNGPPPSPDHVCDHINGVRDDNTWDGHVWN